MTARISVIVPVFNTSGYLAECLDSILSQTFTDFELICIDDGSTDESPSILKRYAAKDNRISVITQANAGLSEARNVGMDSANGEFIVFVDSDDRIDERMLESFIAEIGESDLVVSGVRMTGDTGFKRGISDAKYFHVHDGRFLLDDELRKRIYVNAWGKMYRTTLIKEYGIRFPKGLHYEDHSFHWQYISASGEVSFVGKKMYFYRRRRDSIMDVTFRKGNGALQLLDVFDHIMKTSGGRIRDKELINHLFLSLFSDALEGADDGSKRELIERSKEMVRRYGLTDDGVIGLLDSDADWEETLYGIMRYNDIFLTMCDLVRLKGMLNRDGILSFFKKLLWGTFCRLTE